MGSLPHARGGVSADCHGRYGRRRSSPRTWGCFSGSSHWRNGRKVFPTHVGVFLMLLGQPLGTVGLPHARGGVSGPLVLSSASPMSSPRTWGCFQSPANVVPLSVVFPTHVGVFLSAALPRRCWLCLPHARGGGSRGMIGTGIKPRSSPRTWGCFQLSDG